MTLWQALILAAIAIVAVFIYLMRVAPERK